MITFWKVFFFPMVWSLLYQIASPSICSILFACRVRGFPCTYDNPWLFVNNYWEWEPKNLLGSCEHMDGFVSFEHHHGPDYVSCGLEEPLVSNFVSISLTSLFFFNHFIVHYLGFFSCSFFSNFLGFFLIRFHPFHFCILSI